MRKNFVDPRIDDRDKLDRLATVDRAPSQLWVLRMFRKDLLRAIVDCRSDQAILEQCELLIDDRNILRLHVPDRVWPEFWELLDRINPCRLEVDAVWIWRGDRLWSQSPIRLWLP